VRQRLPYIASTTVQKVSTSTTIHLFAHLNSRITSIGGQRLDSSEPISVLVEKDVALIFDELGGRRSVVDEGDNAKRSTHFALLPNVEELTPADGATSKYDPSLRESLTQSSISLPSTDERTS